MKKLVIDLGHGGYDPGAVGKGGTKESDVVLKIGKYKVFRFYVKGS